MKRSLCSLAVLTWFCLSFNSLNDLTNAITLGGKGAMMKSAATAKIVDDGIGFALVFDGGKDTAQDISTFLQFEHIDAQFCS